MYGAELAARRPTRYAVCCITVETPPSAARRNEMLFTLAVILLIAWLLGVVGTYTVGAFIHVLLVIAIVLFIVGMLTRRRAL
jgi:asparagine N-glycosylation enzyme membrane subunit Stt3